MLRELRATPPYRVLLPGGAARLVLTCEHASPRLPRSVRPDAAERRILRSHWGWDIGAWSVTRLVASALDAPAVAGRWSRLLVDLNRALDDPTLARESADGIRLRWNARLRPPDRRERAVAVHSPFHAAVDRLIAARVAAGVPPLLVAIHTFTPELDGRPRPFDAGVLYDRDRSLALRCARSLRRSGLTVRLNEPYSGKAGMMYCVTRHARTHGLACLELELNQGLFARRGAAERLARFVARALAPVTPGVASRRPVARSRRRS